MRKYKILFIDDEDQILNGIRRNLHKTLNEWELFYANSAEEALHLTVTNSFDLVITDARMPGMNGGELIVALKSHHLTKDIPVMMLTGFADETIKQQALENGVIEFLYKPILPEELILRIKNILQLKKLNDDLRELNEQKNHFLGIAAHDLRSPLQSIISIISMYQLKYQNHLDDYQSTKLESVLKEVRFMKDLINDFLDISAIESGKLTIIKQRVSLCSLFAESINLYSELAENKKITLSHSCPGPETLISADPAKIKQAIDNLLTNAIKFSHAGGVVLFKVEKTERDVLISVQDFGQGIPESEQHILFQPFGKTSIKGTAGEKSTGLGLAIVKKIVEAHGGKIDMQSEFGKGSLFTIHLPNE